MQDNREQAAKIWLLVALLNASRFAIAELHPHQMKHKDKTRLLTLKANIENYLVLLQAGTAKAEKDKFEDAVFENVAGISELFSMIAQMPPQFIGKFVEMSKNTALEAIKIDKPID